MSRKLIGLVVAFSVILLASGVCTADRTGEPVAGLRKGGTVSKGPLNLEKDIQYNYNLTGLDDFVLIGLEGSGMNPHKEGVGLTWIEALREYNLIDFSIANEFERPDLKVRASACEAYPAAVIDVVRSVYPGVKAVGVYAFSKGASAADSLCSKLEEEGIRLAFVWLNDAFTMHDMPYIKNAVEKDGLMIYLRYSNNKRLSQVCKNMHKAWKDRDNVDSKHIPCSHGGLSRYETFTDELTGAMKKASE